MSTNVLLPQSAASDMANDLFAAADIGTKSFKLLIVRADASTGRFLPIDRHKEPVLLGLDTTTTSAAAVITAPSIDRAVTALIKFQKILLLYRIPTSQCRFVATSAVREASNQSEFLSNLYQNLNLDVKVLSGQDEARLIYLGVLQFLPVIDDTILTVDIGGGSTEFIIGNKDNILFAISLKLGHVTLTQQFFEITKMRQHIRTVLYNSGLVDRVEKYKINKVIGSSGTIKGIEKAVHEGYAKKNVGEIKSDTYRKWTFNKEELMELVESLEMKGKKKREEFFEKRAEFIIAGAVLLEEIFKGLGIVEMEVSEYALAEGVVAEMLRKVDERLNVDVRWLSVVRLATRLCSKKRIKSSALCAGIAKKMFEGITKWNVIDSELVKYLEEKDIEYLEAACLLRKIGLFAGKKGYHERSYQLIINGNHLQGFGDHEIKLIGVLVKHHRKKFPKADDTSLEGFTEEVKHKLTMLCAILRLSTIIEQLQAVDDPRYKFSHSSQGFRLALGEGRNQRLSAGLVQPLAQMVKEELDEEVENFRRVFKKNLSVMVQ